MKIVCSSCGHEHELASDGAGGPPQGEQERCPQCGASLAAEGAGGEPPAQVAAADEEPTAASRRASDQETADAPEGEAPAAGPVPAAAGDDLELDAIRSEIEAEVGSLFEVEPSRAVHTSGYLIGDRRQKARAPSDPSFPAYKVVEVTSPRLKVPAEPAATPAVEAAPAARAGAPAAQQERQAAQAAGRPATKAPPPASQPPAPDVEWQPAASELASLLEEEAAAARARESKEQVDELLKPPELKPKPAPPPEPPPPPAFDEDIAGTAGARRRGGAADLLPGRAGKGAAPDRQRQLLLALAVVGAVLILGLISVIVLLLTRQPGYGTGTPPVAQAPPQGGETPTAAPTGDPVPATGTGAPAGSPAGAVVPDAAVAAAPPSTPDAGAPDTTRPDTARPDTARPDLAPPPPPPPVDERPEPVPREDKRVAVATAPKGKPPAPPAAEQPEAKPKPGAADVAAAAAPAEPKPKRVPGVRPPGCDPVAYPDPMDCPADRPPSKDEILAVVRRHVRDIDLCAKKQHAVDPALATGTIVMRWWIYPSGETKQVTVVSEEHRRTVVGNCMEDAIQKWHFGEYRGKRVGPITMPFKLKTK